MIFCSCSCSFFSRMRYSRSASFCSRGANEYFSCRSYRRCSLRLRLLAPRRENPQKMATEAPRKSCHPLGPRAPLVKLSGVYAFMYGGTVHGKTKQEVGIGDVEVSNGKMSRNFWLSKLTLRNPPGGGISCLGMK